jgi:hypothetical protein
MQSCDIFVIASEAKQSICDINVDCRVASLLAMTKSKPRLNSHYTGSILSCLAAFMLVFFCNTVIMAS